MLRFTIHPLAAVVVAIGVTSGLDAVGLTAFSALPLLPLALLCWWRTPYPRRTVGLTLPSWRAYTPAIVHPLLVIGAITGSAAFCGAFEISNVAWGAAWPRIAAVSSAAIVVALFTEEGFFRGWLWPALEQRGMSSRAVWATTSLVFALWHLSGVLLPTGFDVPLARAPLFIVNAAVLGGIWGRMRMTCGSIIASSVAHGVWNGVAYVLFGYGMKSGALGIRNTTLYGPEVGALGLGLNVVLLGGLWLATARHRSARSRNE